MSDRMKCIELTNDRTSKVVATKAITLQKHNNGTITIGFRDFTKSPREMFLPYVSLEKAIEFSEELQNMIKSM